MSNEVKTKAKIDMDPKYIIELTLKLFVTCVVVAGLLGGVKGRVDLNKLMDETRMAWFRGKE